MGFLPVAGERRGAVAELQEAAAHARAVIVLGTVAVPAVVVQAGHAVEVEQHAAGILVHEHGLGRAGSVVDLDLARLRAGRDHHAHGIPVTGGHLDRVSAREFDGDRREQVGAVDADGLAFLRPLVGHAGNLRCRREDLEVIGHDGAVAGDQVHLVRLLLGHVLGHRHQDGVRGHVARVQDGGLVVEVDVVDAGQVVTDHAHELFHIGLGDGDVPVRIADEVDGRNAGRLLVAVRIVQIGAGSGQNHTQDDACIFGYRFHRFTD